MNRKLHYEQPVSKELRLWVDTTFCASYTGPQTTYTGQVNDFSDIDEVDISNLWNN